MSAILILTIILSFPGCKNKDTEDIEYTYKENKIELPSEYTRVIDMCVQQSGELRIAVSNSNNSKISIFDSSDNGNSWNMICNVSDLLDLPESSITNIIISDNNSFFCENCLNVKNNEDIFTGEKKYYYFNNGDYTNVDIKLDNISIDDFVNVYGKIVSDSNVEIVNGVASGSFSDDGNLFISDYLGKGYLFDSTSWEKISEYKINEKMNQVEDICHYDDYTIAVSYEGSLFYDYLKGNVSEESNLEDNITNVISDAQNTTTNSGNFLCVKGDALYFFNACGLYEYSNNEWNQISERTGPFGTDSEKSGSFIPLTSRHCRHHKAARNCFRAACPSSFFSTRPARAAFSARARRWGDPPCRSRRTTLPEYPARARPARPRGSSGRPSPAAGTRPAGRPARCGAGIPRSTPAWARRFPPESPRSSWTPAPRDPAAPCGRARRPRRCSRRRTDGCP